jgi:hypothetical protein
LCDSFCPELEFGEQPIVRPAHQSQIFRCVGAAERPGALVMKLQECARFAAMPIFADERAALPIAFHDRPPHVVAHVRPSPLGFRRMRCRSRCSMSPRRYRVQSSLLRTVRSRRLCLGKASRLQPGVQLVERALNDDGKISRRICMAH